jgi:hypothetical protein
MANETNLHRAARILQRHSSLSFQQALELVQQARPRPTLRNADDVAAFLAKSAAPGPANLASNATSEESQLRQHLRAYHSVETFDPDATEASLGEFHDWDHATGEMGPEHDPDDLGGTTDSPVVDHAAIVAARTTVMLHAARANHGGEALCDRCSEPIEELQDGSGDWIHVASQRISCDGYPEGMLDEDDPRATPALEYLEQAARDARDDLCSVCKLVDHQSCSLDPHCSCCQGTIIQMAEGQ